MSLLSGFNKRSKLNAMIKQTEQARHSDGVNADALFAGAYQGYANVLQDDPLRADTLYHWGFALLHQAKSKTNEEAEKLYCDALTKFDFCLLINPSYLGAAINGGVAYMDLARLLEVEPDNEFYDSARQQFERANQIHKGTASYNLACIHALRNEQELCLKALKHAREHGSLPEIEDILNDPDMDNVKAEQWFIDFITPATAVEPEAQHTPTPESETTETLPETDAVSSASEEHTAEPAIHVENTTDIENATVEPAKTDDTP